MSGPKPSQHTPDAAAGSTTSSSNQETKALLGDDDDDEMIEVYDASERYEDDAVHATTTTTTTTTIDADDGPATSSTRRQESKSDNTTTTTTTTPNEEQQLAQLAQLAQHQKDTIQAIHELSHTMTHLMVAQLKLQKDKDADDNDTDDQQLNVDRATVRLDGLEVYAVVSALTVATSIACFDVYNGADMTVVTTTDNNAGYSYHAIAALLLNTIFLAVSGIGIIAGLHATLVFSLMTMYGRTAVGVCHDEAFVEFFVQTGRVRYRGFHTFRLSLYCFLVQVLFTITSKSTPLLRPVIIAINLASMYWVYKDTQSVIDKAGDILFNLTTTTKSQPPSRSTSSSLSSNNQSASTDGGPLSLKRTLSIGTNVHHDTQNTTSALEKLRQRAKQQLQQPTKQQQSQHEDTTTTPSATPAPTRTKRTPARSKSGVVIYDVAPGESRPARRARRKPGRK